MGLFRDWGLMHENGAEKRLGAYREELNRDSGFTEKTGCSDIRHGLNKDWRLIRNGLEEIR